MQIIRLFRIAKTQEDGVDAPRSQHCTKRSLGGVRFMPEKYHCRKMDRAP